MREIDLLPSWYSDLLRRKNLLRLQGIAAAFAVLVVLGWTLVNAAQIDTTRELLDQKHAELLISSQRVLQRTVQQQLRDQLRAQDRVESSLGLDVESSRILDLISHALPDSASLVELTMETDERVRPLLQQLIVKNSPPSLATDRRLQVTMKCAAPANIDVATLLENLTTAGVCQNLRLNYLKEKVVNNVVRREFEVAFQINLNCEGATQ